MGVAAHAPLPSENQLILVKTPKGIQETSDYMPIKGAGTLRITPQDKVLYLIQGEKNIALSYSLDNAIIKPYNTTH